MIWITAILLFSTVTSAGSIQYNWNATPSDVSIDEFNQWDVISVENGMSVFANGYPSLPGVPRCYVIPQGTSVTGIEVSNITTVSLGRLLLPAPVMILPLVEDVPECSNYTELCFEGLPGVFPESQVAGYKTGTKTGFRLGSYSFVPFRYSYDTGELFLITSADINLIYESDPEAPLYHLTEAQVELARRGLATFVDNPEMLDIWTPSARAGTDDDVEVIIIGINHHLTELNELVSLHNTLGYASDKVTIEWIQDNQEGYDIPEKIRNYIKFLYENNGLQFAVMVTDEGETTRHSSLQVPYHPIGTDTESDWITDLYFSDLDGTWDMSGNHQYGEEFDLVDYYSDIYVGRYPIAETETNLLMTMIDKAVNYNTSPEPGDWQKQVMLIGAVMYTDREWGFGSKVSDSLASFITPDFQVDTLNEDTLQGHPSNQLELFAQGRSFVSYTAHGCDEECIWLFPFEVIFSCDSVPIMTNGEKLPWVIGRLCCYTGFIGGDSGLTEMMVEHDGGGAIVAAASSSWGYAGSTEPGPSAWVDIYFTYLLFQQNIVTAGVTNGLAKDVLWATSNSFYVPRLAEWVLQSTNLLGDPCTVFTAAPQGVENQPVECLNVSISPNPAQNTMNVSVSLSDTAPVEIVVYDMLGRAILISGESMGEAGGNSLALDTSGLASGMYMVQVNSQGIAETAKCVVIR